MSACNADIRNPSSRPPRRRRWPIVLGCIAALLVVGAVVVAYFLQPTQLTALILGRASQALKLELHTSGPGTYALRPEPRLVLPGLSATVPGQTMPFFRSAQVELALPWSTLRGRSTDISSIVMKSPDIDLPAMQRWMATRPPSVAPFKLPRLTGGLRIDDGLLRGTSWRIERLAIALPSLADGKPATLDASGNLLRGANASKFALTLASTPAGMGHGLRIDNARLTLKADGELPSLTASGSMVAADAFALDLAGAIQGMPKEWSAAIDSTFASPSETPFSIVFNSGAQAAVAIAAGTAPIAGIQNNLRLRLTLGDAKRQPALTLNGEASRGDALSASLQGQLSRWPDAWPALPPALVASEAPIQFDASYQGLRNLGAPIAFDVHRADTRLQGKFRIADIGAWATRKFDALLPPIEATLSAPLLNIGGMQLRGVRMDIREDVAPAQPATKPPVVAPKS